MSDPKHVTVNGPTVEIVERKDVPFMLVESVATLRNPATGEVMEITRCVTNPFVFRIGGDKLAALIDLSSVFQETAMHVVRENA